jgi:hypothetical protein
MVTEVNAVQFLKEYELMVVTETGIVIEVTLEQPLKADMGIVVSEVPNVMVVAEVHMVK